MINIEELVKRLKKIDFNIGNFQLSNFYKENKLEDISIGIYARISKRDLNAIEQQIKTINFFLEKLTGLKIEALNIYEYFDNGFSGTNSGRVGYSRMKRDLQLGKINVIITSNIDRFGGALETTVSDIYPNGDIQYMLVSIDDRLVNGIDNMPYIKSKAKGADDYAQTCSKRARRGLTTKINEGSVISSRPLYGYGIIKDEDTNKRYYCFGKNKEVEIVKFIFESYIAGKTMNDISRELTQRQVPSPTGKSIWNKLSIEAMLKNPIYSRQLYQGRYYKQGYSFYGEGKKVMKLEKNQWTNCGIFDGIVDVEIYNTVQKMLSENRNIRKGNGSKKLFSGILKCAECGHTLIYKEKWKGYKCSASQHKENKCTTHFVKENQLWNFVSFKIIEKIINNQKNIKIKVNEKMQEYTNIKQNQLLIEKIDKKIENATRKIAELYTDGDDVDSMVIKELKKQIKIEENNKNRCLQRLEEEESYKYKMIGILNNIEEFITRDNYIIKLFIKEIKVYQEYRLEIIWRC